MLEHQIYSQDLHNELLKPLLNSLYAIGGATWSLYVYIQAMWNDWVLPTTRQPKHHGHQGAAAGECGMEVLRPTHYNDVIKGVMASQITSLAIVYSSVYSGADQRKHQSSASLAFVRGIHRWPVNSPHKWPVTPKMFPFDDVIMCRPCLRLGLSRSLLRQRLLSLADTLLRRKYEKKLILLLLVSLLLTRNNLNLKMHNQSHPSLQWLPG